jgi:hypothetical protein
MEQLGFLKPRPGMTEATLSDADGAGDNEESTEDFKMGDASERLIKTNEEVCIEIDENSNKFIAESRVSNNNNNNNNNNNKQVNYKEVLFNYKDFNTNNINIVENNNNLKRRNDNPLPDNLEFKIDKKKDWIKREKGFNKKDTGMVFINTNNSRKELTSNENSSGFHEDPNTILSSQALSLESNLNSKAKLDNNFKKTVDYSSFTNKLNAIKNKKEQVDNKNTGGYDLDLKTMEDKDDSFFELKTERVGNKISLPDKNDEQRKKSSLGVKPSSPKMINYKLKKEREKLTGYRCEICQNVSKIFNFSFTK